MIFYKGWEDGIWLALRAMHATYDENLISGLTTGNLFLKRKLEIKW
jgi:hypothetical protein